MRRSTIALLSLAALCTVTAARAEDAPTGPLYAVHQELVKPSMVAQYESSSKDFVHMVVAHHDAAPSFSATALQGEDFIYTYIAPIANMAAMDELPKELAALAKVSGAAFMSMSKANNAAIESIREWVVRERPDLSYMPKTPREKLEDQRFFHYDFYYLQTEHADDAAAVARDFLAAFKSKNVPDGYRVFIAEMGPETPLLIVEVGAKDAADYYTANAQARAMLGEDGAKLFGRAFAITRRFDSRNTMLRPDLTIPPLVSKK